MTTPQDERMPATTRTLTATITVIAVGGLFATAVSVGDPDRRIVAAVGGVLGVTALIAAVGLWRAWAAAWWLTGAVAVLAVLTMFALGPCPGVLGLVLAAGVLWGLTRAETKWWLRRD